MPTSSTVYAIATMDTKGSASSMERLPTERAITNQVGEFTELRLSQRGSSN
jgi:predicted TIM-barrel enzyme